MTSPVQIMTAAALLPDGTIVASIERVRIGGGIRVIEGEEHTHPSFERFHVRLLSPDRMIPDQLHDVQTYEDAVDLAERYAVKRAAHAARVDELAKDLNL